jgi:hypothetical protein
VFVVEKQITQQNNKKTAFGAIINETNNTNEQKKQKPETESRN